MRSLSSYITSTILFVILLLEKYKLDCSFFIYSRNSNLTKFKQTDRYIDR